MNRILSDMKAFGLQYIRNPVGAFFALGFPLILILVFGSVFSQSGETIVPIEIQDLDGSERSAEFLQHLNNTTVLHVSMIPPEADLGEYIKDNSLSFALLIPEGFGEAVDSNLSVSFRAHVTLYGDKSRSTYGVVVTAVSSAATAMNFRIADAPPAIGMNLENIVAGGFEYIDFFLPGMIAFTIMTNALFAQSSSSAEYRTRGYFKLLATTPLAKWEWTLAKFLWYVLIMFTSVLIMFLVSIPLFNIHVLITPSALAMMAGGILLFVSMGMLIGNIAEEAESAAAIANAIGFPMMFLSGTFFPIETMPDFLQKVAYLLPLTYMSEGLRNTMIYGNETAALIDLLIILILGVIFYLAASRMLRWKEE